YVASRYLQGRLRLVASFTQLLAKRYSGKLDETADQYIEYAVDGAKRMQQLIGDLLAYSRVNSKELDIRQADSEALLAAAMQNLGVGIEESGAFVDCDQLPEVWVDKAQFIQLFQDLLGNAIKFRHKETPLRIRISAEDPGTGIGLAVCQRVAERHGGKIWVESKPGVGSTFRFTIPKPGNSK